MPTTTLYLQRGAGTKQVDVSWNGNITDYWNGDHLQPTHRYLWEMDDDERAERLAELGAYHAE